MSSPLFAESAAQLVESHGDRIVPVALDLTDRDSIYAAQGMRWRSGLGNDVPALTVARICGSGAEALSVGAEMMLAGIRHDEARPFTVVGGGEIGRAHV